MPFSNFPVPGRTGGTGAAPPWQFATLLLHLLRAKKARRVILNRNRRGWREGLPVGSNVVIPAVGAGDAYQFQALPAVVVSGWHSPSLWTRVRLSDGLYSHLTLDWLVVTPLKERSADRLVHIVVLALVFSYDFSLPRALGLIAFAIVKHIRNRHKQASSAIDNTLHCPIRVRD